MELADLKKAMKGVFILQITPFNTDGSLDLEGMRSNTGWLLERTRGKDFVFVPCGSIGEFFSMSDDENKAIIRTVVEEVNGKHPVMVGAGRAGTLETIKMCQYAQSVGADGVLLILPYYGVPEEEGMYQHYKQIAESVDNNFGIIIYNNPGMTKSWIKPPLMKRLAKIPNIVGVKESTPDVKAYCAMRKAIDPKDAEIITGRGETIFLFEALCGARSFFSGRASFAPDLLYSVYEARENYSKLVEAVEPWHLFFSFLDRVAARHSPHVGVTGSIYTSNLSYIDTVAVKAAMDIVGIRGGEARLPITGLTNEEKNELRGVLKTMGVISGVN